MKCLCPFWSQSNPSPLQNNRGKKKPKVLVIVLAPMVCPFQKVFMKIALTWLHGFIRIFVHLLAYSKMYIILYPFWQKLQWKPIHIVMRQRLICPANLFRLSSICHNSISPPFTSSHNKKIYIHMQCNANICSIMQMGSCKLSVADAKSGISVSVWRQLSNYCTR